jgi:hypothetical protein
MAEYSRTGVGRWLLGTFTEANIINGFRHRMANCTVWDRQKENEKNFEDEEKTMKEEGITSSRRKRKFED